MIQARRQCDFSGKDLSDNLRTKRLKDFPGKSIHSEGNKMENYGKMYLQISSSSFIEFIIYYI